MSKTRLPELVDQILHDLSSLGFPVPIRNQYEPPVRECILQDPDRIAKVFTVFFMQLLSGRKGNSCSLQWDYREGILSVILLEPCSPEMEASFSHTRTSLQCLGGTLSFENERCLLTLPLASSPYPGRDPSGSPSREFFEAPAPHPSKDVAAPWFKAAHPDSQEPVFDPAVLQQACPDEAFSRQLMEEFLSHCRNHLQELEQLITQGNPVDLVKLHRIAHSIKGGGLNVGALRLAKVARWMEQQAKGGALEGIENALTRLKEEESLLESNYRKYYERKANPPG